MNDTTPPNILFILVDEMRYPMHFPLGVSSPDQFMQKFMPHTYRLLWQPGVRFHNAYTAASDCTPARGTIVTGLYAQQTFCMTTRANKDNPQSGFAIQPPLHPAFPTYGKILRAAGYDTPYVGKWHLSNFPPPTPLQLHCHPEPQKSTHKGESTAAKDPLRLHAFRSRQGVLRRHAYDSWENPAAQDDRGMTGQVEF